MKSSRLVPATSWALSLILATTAAAQAPRAAQPAAVPSLIVMITVDQLRSDYFTLYDGQFTGGLARLYSGGAVYLNGYHDHAITETAPGHASVLSGRFPRSTGIVANVLGVQDPQFPLVGARGEPASPSRFRGSTLADWLLARDRGARILSVSRKDRGAILPVGRSKQEVYWYASDGTFTTSTYYTNTRPLWVRNFNARRLPHQWTGKSWDLLLDPSEYPEPDSVPQESRGSEFTFPHLFPSDSAATATSLPTYPMMDEVTLAFALEGVQQLQLGTRDRTDLLAVSLSTTDAIGHRFGMDSREMHDHILRLDRYLGAFIDSLYRLRDSSRIVIALTADHGMSPLPGMKSRDPNEEAGFVDMRPALERVRAGLRAARANPEAVTFTEGMLLMNNVELRRARLRPDSVAQAFAAYAVEIHGVRRAELVRNLARRDTVMDDVSRRWLHMLPDWLPAAVVVTLEPYWYWEGDTYPTHGSPYDSDARVPVIFYGAGIEPAQHNERALVVDIAPTLAAVARVRPTERLDGRVLHSALREE